MIYQRQTCQEHAKKGTQTDVKKNQGASEDSEGAFLKQLKASQDHFGL
jgi:hypothetical protein